MPPQDPRLRQPPFPTPVAPLPRSPGQTLESTPYDFIMNSTKGKRGSGLNLKGGPKLLYIAGGGAALVVILFLVMALGGGKSADSAYVQLAQQQQEIGRVAGLDYDQLQDDSVKNFTINTLLSMQTAQATFTTYLNSHGAKVSTKQLAAGMNSRNDAQLAAAQTNGGLDPAVHDLLVSLLTTYEQSIRTTYQSAHNPRTKQQLQSLYNQADLLLQQSKS